MFSEHYFQLRRWEFCPGKHGLANKSSGILIGHAPSVEGKKSEKGRPVAPSFLLTGEMDRIYNHFSFWNHHSGNGD
jgi:hypothetical protein